MYAHTKIMKRFLVCTDGSLPYAESCYAYAEWMAKKLGAVADILYVSDLKQFEISMMADFSGSLGVQPYQNLYTQLQEMEKQKTAIVKKNVEKFFKKADLLNRIQFHHRTGSLVDVYHEFENSELGVDLVVIGKRGENADFATEHLGSSMERVVRASTKPCLVVPRKFVSAKKLLIAYDGSSSVNKAIQFLVRTEEFSDLETHIVTVVHDPNVSEEKLIGLQKAEEALSSAGYKPKCQMLTGETEEVISSYVSEEKIDLLVMGAYGHSAMRHLLIGSTTTDLLRRCRIAVLLFR